MKVRLLRPALTDLIEGRIFYDRQQEKLGEYFLGNIFEEIDRLERHAGIHRQQFEFYRAVLRRFPYAIYYKIIQNEVLVFRVLDCRRDPGTVRNALRST